MKPIDFQSTLDETVEFGKYIKPMISDVAGILHDLRKQGKRVLFEGAQGSLLDIDHGTYPYVTSSNTTIGGALAGTGVGADAIDYVLGIAKAYATRVGGGPFPTELNDETGQLIRDKGSEYGATTGRPRRCGWIDIVALKRAVAINGITGLCITKLDILDGMPSLKMCIAYKYHGKQTEYSPLDEAGWDECEPVYLEFPGWTETHGRHYRVGQIAAGSAGIPALAGRVGGLSDCHRLNRPGPRCQHRVARSVCLIQKTLTEVRVIWCPRGDSNPHDRSR